MQNLENEKLTWEAPIIIFSSTKNTENGSVHASFLEGIHSVESSNFRSS